MTNENEFQQRIQQIGERVHQLEEVADPATGAAAKELMQLLMELHGAAIERMLDITYESGDAGVKLIDEFGRDQLVSSLLVLYGLHPEDLQTRVEHKLAEMRSRLYKMGAEVKAIEIVGGDVRIRAGVEGHGCGSTAANVKAAIEQAVYDAAPDLHALVVEGLEEKSASGFVAIDALLETAATSSALASRLPARAGEGLD